MHDGPPGALQRVQGGLDQVFPGLGEHLDRHVLGHRIRLDQLTQKFPLTSRRGGKAHLDLAKAHRHQGIEEPALGLGPHGLTQGLVAIAQVNAAPERRGRQALVRPATIGQIHGRIGTVGIRPHPGRGSLPGRLGGAHFTFFAEHVFFSSGLSTVGSFPRDEPEGAESGRLEEIKRNPRQREAGPKARSPLRPFGGRGLRAFESLFSGFDSV